MPATGKELKVGDITRLEPNIHAGTKYLRFMINEYYKDEPIDDVNKAPLTFASYNAGSAKVAQLRKAAATRGLDANRWFNNVEVIAAERVGQETVRYVANIYKYYIAYKLVSQALEQKAREVKPTVKEAKNPRMRKQAGGHRALSLPNSSLRLSAAGQGEPGARLCLCHNRVLCLSARQHRPPHRALGEA